VIDNRKQPISIRLGASDLRNVKRLAKRLGVRDSDIVRYAVKSMLGRIAPLCDERIVGRDLVPILVESGDELIRHFELDSVRLESIINEHAEERSRVEREDIALLAMSALREQYLLTRIKQDSLGDANGAADASAAARSLRYYLYDKYTPRGPETGAAEHRSGAGAAEGRPRRQRPAA
jgi:hypothetical protein